MEIIEKGDINDKNLFSVIEILMKYIKTDFALYNKPDAIGWAKTSIVYKIDFSQTSLEKIRDNFKITCYRTKTKWIAKVISF